MEQEKSRQYSSYGKVPQLEFKRVYYPSYPAVYDPVHHVSSCSQQHRGMIISRNHGNIAAMGKCRSWNLKEYTILLILPFTILHILFLPVASRIGS